MRTDEILVPCMPLQMKISLDCSSKTSRNVEIEEEQNYQTLKEENKEFFDVQEEKEIEEPRELELFKTQQKRQARKLHRGMLRLQNQQNEIVRV